MSLSKFAAGDASFAPPEVGNTFLRHALKIWAREQGVPESSVPGVIGDVLDFALATVRDGGPPRVASA
jgi:hypothetical protein